jgi:hypothetical protein
MPRRRNVPPPVAVAPPATVEGGLGLAYCYDLRIEPARMASWPPGRISAFFTALVRLQAAAREVEAIYRAPDAPTPEEPPRG